MNRFWEDVERDAEYQAAAEQLAAAIERPCREGCCIEWVDAETGENLGGFGPVGCPCQDDGE